MTLSSPASSLTRCLTGVRAFTQPKRVPSLVRLLERRRTGRLEKKADGIWRCQAIRSMGRAYCSGVAEEETEPVKFKCTASVEFGATMKIVGGSDELGNWDVSKGVQMEWGAGDVWTAAVLLKPGTYELKCVKVRSDGSAVWEPGENRVVEIGELADQEDLTLVDCQFFDVESTAVTSVDEEDEVSSAEEGAESNDATGEEIEPSVQDPASAAGEDCVDSAETEVENSGDSNSEQADEEDQEVVNGSGDSQSDEKSSSAPSVVANDAGNGKEAEGEEDKSDEKVPAGLSAESTQTTESVANEPKASSSKPLPAGSKPSVDSETSSPTKNSSEGNASNPFVATIGLLSVPVVAWSEYTLKTTGCGLEPGPGGIFGALEGIGYLAVTGCAAWFLFKRFSQKSSPEGVEAVAELSSYSVIVAGLVVLALQVQDYGYIPSALPDEKCSAQPTPLDLKGFKVPSVPDGIKLEAPPVPVASSNKSPSTPSVEPTQGAAMGKTTYSVTIPDNN